MGSRIFGSGRNQHSNQSDDSSEKSRIERIVDNPLVAAGFTAVSLTALSAGIVSLADATKKAYDDDRAKVVSSLKDIGGSVALAVGNQIHVIKVDTLIQDNESASRLRFQVGTAPLHLLWLDDQHILYARQHDVPLVATVKGRKDEYTATIASHRIEILNITSGEIATLIDPYTPSVAFTDIFGNTKERDGKIAIEEAEAERKFFDDGKGGIKIRYNNPSAAFVPEDLAFDSLTKDIFVREGGSWYLLAKRDEWQKVSADGTLGHVEKTNRVPDVTAQESSTDGKVQLSASSAPWLSSGFGFRSQTDSPSFVVDKHAGNGAWLIEDKKESKE